MQEEEYRSASQEVEPGKAPTMKVKLLSSVGDVRTYMVIFSKNDEVVSGLTEFALNYNVKSAHFHGIGSAFSLELGWFDFDRLQYQVIPMGIAEVTSFMGNITWLNEKPIVHAHATASLRDGIVKGGHLLALNVGPTFEVIVTVEPTFLYKKLDQEFQAGMIV
ncbi:PPC domain-containing DNA-binding protein [Pontibacter silvestris]|uniref:PPC domain-containing DNA-binding protein n=1 Tax=Pontibacter silvestris TaxID=2305183 RepID=A0ABW4WXD8_9BACT|nr:PPC domain-containing DNA-binding protein [Pontibacter silvestris]MCC9138472.1 DNA-binding protein [Pontibacter silvestris]